MRTTLAITMALLASTSVTAAEAPEFTGAELFQVFCSSCHGKRATGDGPVATALKGKVPDLTRIAVRNGGSYPADRVRRVIDGQDVLAAHGSRDMPVWGWDWYAYKGEDVARRQYVAERVDKLTAYLQSIQQK